MISVRSKAILAASVVGLAGLSAHAAPLVNYSLLGRIVGSGDGYSSTVTVSAGSVIEYQLQGLFAPVGTVNSGTPVRTLTSVGSADGFNNLPRIDLFQTAGATIDANFTAAGTPQAFAGPGGTSNFAAGTGAAAGTPTAGDLLNIKNIAGSGQKAADGTAIYLGTFSIASAAGTSSLVGIRLNGTGSGSSGFTVHINNSTAAAGSNILPTDTTETGANPLIALNGLNLVTASVGPSNNPPTFTAGSGLASGDTGVDATLDIILPVDLAPHSVTFNVPDSFITDEAAASVALSLGTVPAPLVGHISVSGRNIIVTGTYTDYPAMAGVFSVPLVLTDNQAATGAGTFTVNVVPEPASIGLLGLGGLALLRRRKTK